MMKLMRQIFILIVCCFLLGEGSVLFAELTYKHPRVTEIEDKLIKDANTYLKGRFPDMPFLVTISIDPLRRESKPQNDQTTLPYFPMSNEEIIDEWDNPEVSFSRLLLRIKKAVVTVSLPSHIKDEEAIEIKNSLYSFLHLTPARDEVRIIKRKWSMDENYKLYSSIAGGIVFIFLLGLFLISRNSISRLITSIGDMKGSLEGGASAAPIAAPVSRAPAQSSGSNSSDGGGGGAPAGFNDPIQIRKTVNNAIYMLDNDQSFPTLRDMMVLDAVGENDPGALGALLYQFSSKTQKRLLGYSNANWWLEALNNPGECTFETLTIVERLLRNTHEDENRELEKILIVLWRLGDQMANFIKALNQKEAFSILYAMPKAISIQAAKNAFPGAWAAMLDVNFETTELSRERLNQIYDIAIELKPLQDSGALEAYRHTVDMLNYLRVSDLTVEYEIYQASPEEFELFKIRPPFYTFFEADEEIIKKSLQVFSIDQWSLALFDVANDKRNIVMQYMTEKQDFMFLDKQRGFEKEPPAKEEVGKVREMIGKWHYDMVKLAKGEDPDANDDENQDDELSAIDPKTVSRLLSEAEEKKKAAPATQTVAEVADLDVEVDDLEAMLQGDGDDSEDFFAARSDEEEEVNDEAIIEEMIEEAAKEGTPDEPPAPEKQISEEEFLPSGEEEVEISEETGQDEGTTSDDLSELTGEGDLADELGISQEELDKLSKVG